MLTDHERIARQQGEPALLRLQRALSRLKSVLTYMNTGAHPDDEHSGLLAALRFHTACGSWSPARPAARVGRMPSGPSGARRSASFAPARWRPPRE